LGVWQLASPLVSVPSAVVGLGLLVLGLAVGLRIGTDATQELVRDTIRMNQLLKEQNQELVALNETLLKSHSAASPESSKEGQAERRAI
jgi:hypothetical protein